MRLLSKAAFATRMLQRRMMRPPRACPYCGESRELNLLGRKKLLLDVLRCPACRLTFRWPLETETESHRFYQGRYAEGAITRLPRPAELSRLVKSAFRGTSLDLAAKIEILSALRPCGRVLDFGCSWGYGIHQLIARGYEAIGYEVSARRAAFGRRKLGVPIVDNARDLARLPSNSFDVIFSNHVLEHTPSIREVLDQFARLLVPGGLAFIVLPNFSGRAAIGGRFWNWIGEPHPLAPTREFFLHNLPRHGLRNVVTASDPFHVGMARHLQARHSDELPQDGDELLVLAWREDPASRETTACASR